MTETPRATARDHRDKALATGDEIWREHRWKIYLGGFLSWIAPLVVVIISMILNLWVSLAVCAPAAVLFFVLGTRSSWQARQRHLANRQRIIGMWEGPIECDRLLAETKDKLAAMQASPGET